MADLSTNNDLEEYSKSSTTIAFDCPLPLLRGPVRSSPSGPFVLAFRDVAAWKNAFRACESRISDQCEAAARIGCAMTASSKCKPPWWRDLAGPRSEDFKERERCEEREMKGCMDVAKEKCSEFATKKCRRSFVEARVSARVKSGVADIVSLATVMDKSFWIGFFGFNRLRKEFEETHYKASELIGRNSEIDCVLVQNLYSRTASEVERAATELLENVRAKRREVAQVAIGFDIEWKASFRKGSSPGKVAVMQLCVDADHCHVMHIFHSGIPKRLKSILENSMLLKVGVGIGNDAVKVFKDYDISVEAVEELGYLARQKIAGESRCWSLASLTENLVSKQLLKSKKIQLGNWEVKSLSKDQLDYAATDAFASWYLYQVLRTLPDLVKVSDENISGETFV